MREKKLYLTYKQNCPRKHFSKPDMPEANLLNGKEATEEVSQKIRDAIATLSVTPTLAIIQVGGREDSSTYIRLKEKFASAVGVKTLHINLPSTATETEVTSAIERLNGDASVHGIIVQLPLDTVQPIDSTTVINCIAPAKDVDGLTFTSCGQLTQGKALTRGNVHLPPTPLGCLELIRKSGVPIAGSRAVVIGRSAIVGAPMAQLLLWDDATVTVCHSKTEPNQLADICQKADILVVAAGQAKLVKKSWVKEGAVVIDVGINELEDSSRKSGYRLVGDVDFEKVKDVAGWITPVPGGVGPMTVAMLISNTVNAARLQTQPIQKS